MDVITAYINADYDCLGAMVASFLCVALERNPLK
jgi:hypothetical protein